MTSAFPSKPLLSNLVPHYEPLAFNLDPMVDQVLEHYQINMAEDNLHREAIKPTQIGMQNSEYTLHVLNQLIDAIDESDIAVRIAKSVQATMFDYFGVSLISSSTLGELFERASRLGSLLGKGYEFTHEMCDEFFYGSYQLTPGFPEQKNQQLLCETYLGFMVKTIRLVCNGHYAPEAIALTRPYSAEIERSYRNYFRCPIQFGQKNNYIIGKRDDLKTRLRGANPKLAEHAEKQCIIALSQTEESMAQKTESLIIKNLPKGRATKESVAAELNIGPRTLQQKLEEEGFTFKDILEDIRRRIALEMLKNGAMSIKEISSYLGYRDTSNFSRAFKRWTGLPPKNYMERNC